MGVLFGFVSRFSDAIIIIIIILMIMIISLVLIYL